MSNLIRFMRGVRIQAAHFQPERLRWRSLDKTKLLVPFRLFFHPVETMNDIKFEGRGSLALANFPVFCRADDGFFHDRLSVQRPRYPAI